MVFDAPDWNLLHCFVYDLSINISYVMVSSLLITPVNINRLLG